MSSRNGATSNEDYFIPPTPAPRHGGEQQAPWTPFSPDDVAANRTAGQDGFFGAGSNNQGEARSRSSTQIGSSPITSDRRLPPGTGQNGGQSHGSPWGGPMAPPAFALSPSSTAFNASFDRLGGFNLNNTPPTPLYAPSAPSPFIPPDTQTQQNPFDSVPTPSAATAGDSTPSFQTAAAPKFNFPTSLPPFAAGRKVAPRGSVRPSPAASSQISAATARYTSIVPTSLFSLLQSSLASSSESPPLLILDIRTHAAYLSERFTGSLNVCVPSTLLRRPGYGVDRVQEGLPESEQDTFSHWNSCETIVVIDTESTSLNEGSSGVASLLAKFDRAGFKGKLDWVKGGWSAVKTQARGLPRSDLAKLFQSGSGSPTSSPAPTPSLASSGPASGAPDQSQQPFHLNQPPGSKKHGRPVLQVRDLPMAAFQVASTSAFVHSGLPTSSNGISVTSPSSDGSSSSRRPNLGKRRKSSNDPTLGDSTGFTLGSKASGNGSMPTPIGEVPGTLRGGGRNVEGAMKMSTNPFFDNIRQNSEALSLDRSLANLSPVELPSVPSSVLPTLPRFLRELIDLSPMQRADKLARQFYELEVAERERLEGTFRWHARHTALEAAPQAGGTMADGEESPETKRWKKFGISAGVELGSLNRFKNIFPYEYRRVKLTDHSSGSTDYINASHLRLPPSSKRFIASQGPLPTTYSDFWQMCEQESVGVIIMLTNLNEGGREKCGRYWINPPDGQKDWIVTVEGDQAHEEESIQWKKDQDKYGGGLFGGGASTGGFFAPADAEIAARDEPKPTTSADCTVRRTLTVTRVGGRGFNPSTTNTKPRKIRHIQYRAWPDFDIPADPSDVVSLIDEVDAAQSKYMAEIGWKPEEHDGLEPPILAHCSAGVGRTGVFIMVSSMLDKMRRERRAAKVEKKDRLDSMDVDSNSPPVSGAVTPTRPDLVSRSSDPETSSLSAHFSLSSLDSAQASPARSSTPAQSLSPKSSTTSLRRPEPSSISGPHPVLPPYDDPTPPLLQDDPVFAGVNALREQRMSMVANYRQYVCVVECVLEGIVREEMQGENESK